MYETAIPIQDHEVLLGGVEIVVYLNGEGVECYRIRHGGDLSLSTTLGLLEMGKLDVMGQSDWTPATEPDDQP